MCLNKQTYKSKEQAAKVIRDAKKRGFIVDSSLHPYKCPFCFKFHLGHTKRS